MKGTQKTPGNEQPKQMNTANRLNDIHDTLRKIQCATSFLGVATTDLKEKYSEEIMWGSRICFDMVDEHTEKLLGDIAELASEVKLHEDH